MLREDQFPLLEKYTKRPELLVDAIRAIVTGVAADSIRNVTLNDAKERISRAVYDAWKLHVNAHFTNDGKWQSLPKETQELDHSIMIMGLHDMIATSKKLAKTKATGPMVDAMREFVGEVLPLAEAVKSLKSKVVKGRAPSEAPSKPENPNKIVRTCPCCFRAIAVRGTTLAHHGYERPGDGWQTASCPGIRFKPLERSKEGLEWITTATKEQLASAQAAFKSRGELTTLMIMEGRKPVEITKESQKWDREFRHHVSKLEARIANLKYAVSEFEKKLSVWVQTEAE